MLDFTGMRYITLMRPHQYLKNLFIFSPIFFAAKFTDAGLLLSSLGAFASFSLIASAVYIFNDYHDAAEDRAHPKKKDRPLAAGTVSKGFALTLMAVLLAVGLGAAAALSTKMLVLALLYVALNAAYTLKLRHVAVVDVFIVAIGFVIRLYVGSAVTSIELSMWIILITFVLALFLAFAKRRDDFMLYLETGLKVRGSIDGYNLEVLNASMVVMASVIIVSYIMYTISDEVIARVGNESLYLTVAFVILGILRYMQITFVERLSGSPTEVLMKDRFIQLTVTGWLLTFGAFLYL